MYFFELWSSFYVGFIKKQDIYVNTSISKGISLVFKEEFNISSW